MRARFLVLGPTLLACAHAQVGARAPQTGTAKPEGPPEPPPASLDESLARLRLKVAKIAADSKLPNGALGIVRGHRLIWFQAFGTRLPPAAFPAAGIDENTVFRIGSITKTLTGVALLQLRDAGKLSLDDRLSKYIPEAARVIAPGGERTPIRLWNLVTHSSGLPREINYWGVATPGPSEATLIATLDGLHLDFEPGTDAQYSNYAMALAGVVVARASGESYRDYMRRHVLEPLGMSRTFFDPAELPPGALATGYDRETDEKPYAPIANQVDLRALEACGGLYSTIADLARFAAFELDAWSGTDDRVLSRASRLESQAPAPLPLLSGGFVGVDWQLADSKMGRQVWHNGGIDGYRSVFTLYPKRGVAIIALTGSTDQPPLWTMEDAAVQALLPFVPSPRARLEPGIAAALGRLMDFLGAPSPDSMAQAFSQAFRKDLSDAHLLDDAKKIQSEVGACPERGVPASGGSSSASVWYTCKKRSVRMDVSIDMPTGKIVSWRYHWDS